jgi:uncharacterized protein YukE
MVQAIADPQELRRFSGNLRQFSNNLNEISRRAKSQFSQLGNTWRDQEYQKFKREFDQTMAALNRFIPMAEQYANHLAKKAEPLESYLGR